LKPWKARKLTYSHATDNARRSPKCFHETGIGDITYSGRSSFRKTIPNEEKIPRDSVKRATNSELAVEKAGGRSVPGWP
jgi:hypothetical protein